MPRSVHPFSSVESTVPPDTDQVAQPVVGADPMVEAGADTGPDASIEAASDATSAANNVLVVTHSLQGEILSLHWPQAIDCVDCEDFVGRSVEILFGPVAVGPYLAHTQKVLSSQTPESFQCVVRCGQQPVSFEFLLSPLPQGAANLASSDDGGLEEERDRTGGVIGVGRRLIPEVSQLSDVRFVGDKGMGGSYYALLSRVASNIRKTLDLKTIWQQTVNGLGNML
ncbi:MAG: hypothetical protein AAGJ95_13170, partial [Cyanobacteria bacterium J06554_11]